MAKFEPPTNDEVVYADYFNRTIETRLFSRVVPSPRGVNIWKLNDGSYTEFEPLEGEFVFVYYGGHIYDVDDLEVASLTGAGYGDYIEA
jgi:hypothetical protein